MTGLLCAHFTNLSNNHGPKILLSTFNIVCICSSIFFISVNFYLCDVVKSAYFRIKLEEIRCSGPGNAFSNSSFTQRIPLESLEDEVSHDVRTNSYPTLPLYSTLPRHLEIC